MFKSDREIHIPGTDLLSWVFGQANHDLDKPIYIDAHDASNAISERQARSCVRRLIGGLRARGVRPGDAVCMHVFNNIHYALLYLAIIGCGARYVGTNPAYTTHELAHIMRVSRVEHIIVEPELLERVRPALAECDVRLDHVVIFNTDDQECPPGFESWTSLLEHDEEMWEVFNDEATARGTIAALLTTSGTTGMPKAAAVSHWALVAQGEMINADTDDKPAGIKRLFSLPQFHAFAGPLMNLSPLFKNIPTYIMKKFSLPQYVQYIRDYAITETAIVNPILLGLVALPEGEQRSLASLRTVWVAGAHLDARTQNSLRDVLPPSTRVAQVWGMTEIGWITTLFYPEHDSTGSTGRLLPGFEAKIVDDAGVEVTQDGMPGELLVRGPSLMSGYLGNAAATASTVVDGWLCSGDVGHAQDGKFYVHDRVKDMIKVRGWQVSPTEVEAVLLAHPAVRDAAVLGVPQLPVGEVPRAFVVMSRLQDGGGETSDEALMDYLAQRLAKYKLPTGGIWRIDAIPRSAAGKILKKVLRDEQQLQALVVGKDDGRVGGVGGGGIKAH